MMKFRIFNASVGEATSVAAVYITRLERPSFIHEQRMKYLRRNGKNVAENYKEIFIAYPPEKTCEIECYQIIKWNARKFKFVTVNSHFTEGCEKRNKKIQ